MLLKNYELTNRERGKRERKEGKEKRKGKEGKGRKTGEAEERGRRKKRETGKKRKGKGKPGAEEQGTEQRKGEAGDREGGGGERSTGEGEGRKGKKRKRREPCENLTGAKCSAMSSVHHVRVNFITSHHKPSKNQILQCCSIYRIMVMAHSGMRKYKRVSKSAPILVQCNVFWKTHIHILEESWK